MVKLGSQLAGLTVLVVDDSGDWRDLIRAALQEAGARVVTESSALAALSLVPAIKPHVLISELMMPDMDGCSFLQQLRFLVEAPAALLPVPAIALTVNTDPVLWRRAREIGFAAVLDKLGPLERIVATVLKQAQFSP